MRLKGSNTFPWTALGWVGALAHTGQYKKGSLSSSGTLSTQDFPQILCRLGAILVCAIIVVQLHQVDALGGTPILGCLPCGLWGYCYFLIRTFMLLGYRSSSYAV